MSTRDMTIGSPAKHIVSFALPILAGNLFQQFYNMADMMIVGHVLGDSALAAVGATSAVYSLIITFINGVCSGFSITIANFFGSKNEDELKKAVGISFVLGILLTFFMTIIGLSLSMPLLRLLNTPEEILWQSHEYIRVLYAFMIFTMLYNLFAGMLRALGNSFMPLIFLVVAVALNIILDIIFIYSIGMGVAGAALATVLSQMLSVILCFIYIIRKVSLLYIRKEHLKPDKSLIKDMALMGVSIGVSYSVVDLGSVALQSAVNSFGVYTITAHAAARRVKMMTLMPLVTMGTASATFTSQNLGAGKVGRIQKGIRSAVKLSFIWATLMVIFIFFAGNFMIDLLTGTQKVEIIDTAMLYLRINIPFYYPLGLLFIYRQSLQGLGNKIVPILSSAIELLCKFIIAFLVAPVLGYIGICFTEPVIWVICAIVLIIMFYSDKRIRAEKHGDIVPQ